jgi:hypothetical protein
MLNYVFTTFFAFSSMTAGATGLARACCLDLQG